MIKEKIKVMLLFLYQLTKSLLYFYKLFAFDRENSRRYDKEQRFWGMKSVFSGQFMEEGRSGERANENNEEIWRRSNF